PDFALSASPGSITLPRGGGTATYNVTITSSGGFSSAVTLSVTGLPAGATAKFAPNPATSASTLTVSVPSSVAKGTYTLTISGTGGTPAVTHTTSVTLAKSK
ncbi:MAG: hypothetical protein M3Y80_08895, partial [Verrucomicrobiota bacterium]|nr:hypothetical protein [Verrucomicrobiota bacterium]